MQFEQLLPKRCSRGHAPRREELGRSLNCLLRGRRSPGCRWDSALGAGAVEHGASVPQCGGGLGRPRLQGFLVMNLTRAAIWAVPVVLVFAGTAACSAILGIGDPTYDAGTSPSGSTAGSGGSAGNGSGSISSGGVGGAGSASGTSGAAESGSASGGASTGSVSTGAAASGNVGNSGSPTTGAASGSASTGTSSVSG